MAEEAKTETSAVAKRGPTLSDLAPKGLPRAAWVATLKEQLMSSKDGEPTSAEMLYFATVCHNTGLDPTTRQIYAIFRNTRQKDGTYKPRMTVQTGIDGFRVVAERTKKYAGSKEPDFEYDPDVKITINNNGTEKTVPNKARVTVVKLAGKSETPFDVTRTAKWEDYYPGDKEGNMWRKLPETMLAKVAEAQALRVAFPNEMSGLYLDEEMAQADVIEGTDAPSMDEIKKQIADAKNYDDLMDVLGNQTADIQKQITPLVDARAKELTSDNPTD